MKKLTLPGSKSITNRDLILASLCDGETFLKGILDSDDTKFMIQALKNLGILIEIKGKNLVINGGIKKIKGENQEIFLGASGTSIRFLTAFCALNKIGKITLKGTERLNKRPIGDLILGLKQLGFEIKSNGDFPPIEIFNSEILENKAKISGKSSSQFFTALLQIGALLPNGLELEVEGDLVSKPYIDITINELSKFGIKVENQNYQKFLVKKQEFKSPEILNIEGDASSFSYISAFSILHGKNIQIENLGKNSKQGDFKFLEILEEIFGLKWESNGEKTILNGGNFLTNFHSKNEYFKGKNIFDFESMPDISMTFMILAPFLKGKTKIIGLQTLNLKECKRIDAMKNELKKFGIEVNSTENWIEIGEFSKGEKKIKIKTYDDHRIAMSFGVFKSFLDKINSGFEIEILDKNCVNKTYPKFWEDLQYLEK